MPRRDTRMTAHSPSAETLLKEINELFALIETNPGTFEEVRRELSEKIAAYSQLVGPSILVRLLRRRFCMLRAKRRKMRRTL